MELLIGKLLALLERGAVKDVWDAANLTTPAFDVLKSSRFRARFIALSAILEHPLSTYHRRRLVSQINDRVIKEQLVPLLARNVSLKAKDLVEKAWALVAPFLDLALPEKDYLAMIYRGELRPEILFPADPEEARIFAGHPAILWKIANIGSHLRDHKDGNR